MVKLGILKGLFRELTPAHQVYFNAYYNYRTMFLQLSMSIIFLQRCTLAIFFRDFSAPCNNDSLMAIYEHQFKLMLYSTTAIYTIIIRCS